MTDLRDVDPAVLRDRYCGALLGLVATSGFDPEDIMARYVAWFDSQPRDVSLTVRTAMLALHSGTPWGLAGIA